VVHFLVRLQRAAEHLLHDPPVLQVPLTVDRDDPVAAAVLAAVPVCGPQAADGSRISMAQNRDTLIMHRAAAARLHRAVTAILGTLAAAFHALRNWRIPVGDASTFPGVVRDAQAASVDLAVAVIQ